MEGRSYGIIIMINKIMLLFKHFYYKSSPVVLQMSMNLGTTEAI